MNDITAENTEVLVTNRGDTVYESYTYGATRIKTDTKEGTNYHVINGKLDIIGTINDRINTWFDYNLSGNALTLSMPRFGYSSESHDGSLQYLRARYYDTETGIFLSQDTYRGTQTDQLSQNRYIYTENNPVNNIDSSGHSLIGIIKGTLKTISKVVASPIAKVVTKVVAITVNFAKDVVTKGLGSAITNLTKSIVAEASVNQQNLLNLQQSQSLKDSGKQIKEITSDQKRSLQVQIAQQQSKLKSLGYSNSEIEAKRLELIRKYCEIYDLDSVAVSKTLSMQDSIRQQSIDRRNQQKDKSLLDKAWDGLTWACQGIVDGVTWVGEKLVEGGKWLIEQFITVVKTLANLAKWLLDYIIKYKHIIIPILAGAITAAMLFFFPVSLVIPTGISFGNLVGAGGVLIGKSIMITTTTVAIPNSIIAVSTTLIMMIAGGGGSDNHNKSSSSSSSSQKEGTGNQVKQEGHGSTGRTTPNNTAEQQAMDKAMTDPLSQSKRIFPKLSDSRWLNWEKHAINIDGIEIHFNYDPINQLFDDFKFIDY